MLTNMLKIAWRHLLRNRVHSLINILGFAIGLAACIVIVLSVVNDLQYDRHYPGPGHVYRIYMQWFNEDYTESTEFAPTCGAMMSRIADKFPEVMSAVRMQYWGPRDVHRGDIASENVSLEVIHSDSSFLDVFGYKMVKGSRADVLRTPQAVLITTTAAEKLFGVEDPIGKPVVLPGNENAYVAAVVEAPPAASHLQFDVVTAFELNEVTQQWLDNWHSFWVLGYLRLPDDVDLDALETKMVYWFYEQVPEWGPDEDEQELMEKLRPFQLMPVEDIHLNTAHFRYNWVNFNGQSVEQIQLLAAIAAAILLLASINFINLSSATAARRAREVGYRKTIGADPLILKLQFLVESVLTTFFATLVSFAIVEISSPWMESLIGKNVGGMLLHNPLLAAAFVLAAFIVGILAGLYPAAVLTSFKPVDVLRGDFRTSKAGRYFRQALVVFQFTISIVLLVSMVVMINQLKYVENRDWGYDREQVMFFQAGEGDQAWTRDDMLTRMNSSTLIVSAGSSNMAPGEPPPYNPVHMGTPEHPDSSFGFIHYDVRGEWFKTLDIPILQGRSFNPESSGDMEHSVLINETAVEMLGLEHPVGEQLLWGPEEDIQTKTIIGVVPDFHMGSAREGQAPAMFHTYNSFARQVVVRLQAGHIKEGIAEVEKIYQDYFSGKPSWSFLDERFEQMYRSDHRLANSIQVFAGLAMLISCLGILGLSSYAIEQRKREIAIRKVLGAEEAGLLVLLNKAFLRWVLFANLVALPLAGWLMHIWLEQYVYRTALSATPFLIAAIVAIGLAMITVTALTIRVARMHPADALRQG